MDAPKCKICGNRHYGQCDTFSRREPVKSLIAAQEAKQEKFDRVAYQREYMRKRRSEAKANA